MAAVRGELRASGNVIGVKVRVGNADQRDAKALGKFAIGVGETGAIDRQRLFPQDDEIRKTSLASSGALTRTTRW
jgi:hypothetical protein